LRACDCAGGNTAAGAGAGAGAGVAGALAAIPVEPLTAAALTARHALPAVLAVDAARRFGPEAAAALRKLLDEVTAAIDEVWGPI
jgi:hypothetical protein